MRDFRYGRDRPDPDDDSLGSDELPASEVTRRLAERMGLRMGGRAG